MNDCFLLLFFLVPEEKEIFVFSVYVRFRQRGRRVKAVLAFLAESFPPKKKSNQLQHFLPFVVNRHSQYSGCVLQLVGGTYGTVSQCAIHENEMCFFFLSSFVCHPSWLIGIQSKCYPHRVRGPLYECINLRF